MSINKPAKAEVMVEAIKVRKQVTTHSGSLTILDSINMQILAGESAAIVGASGAGKSTLLGLLAGLDTVSEGDIRLAGQSLSQLDEDGRASIRGKTAGFVFQSFQLLPALTALENVMLPLELQNRRDAKNRAVELLERVGLKERMTHYPGQLSGGEQQRVAIARAFATEPSILFADEPTGNLDQTTGQHIIDLLFEVNREAGTTLILVTHDMALAARCDRTLQLVGGQLVEESDNAVA
ncbi:ABC transporter ATP-binding protein [Endozoicomonadaceae bacterium StTr2]